ncbi:hypothetical protein EOD10_03490 [Mesorhizobium sp. M7A.T.Ca.TU.009.01.3.2]|jgi:hypothetical protein|uniref:hypothetical protein n=1 Tax=unclassified Mesorhizobium TaxID=325217 RepID=UPI000FCAF43A|nr:MULTISPECIES: hypothetical protein [unclassified Mesorhizobium]RUU23949.1 hypothetical protein EOD10_03490 [Mesorhizobium sp. M7A.T.Ca.TU.009.01.3.2]RUU62103.1 hypothetical protein EOC99_18895 [Mesorhizobium sp. M7A.T.Ca.TU.009.01.1.1]RUU85902.1 hypothetical protein EOD03_08885 [Mesorhizobium sp. M7A.T.Ca.TU.009.01.1.2]RUV08820.1 hypothetical protein EOD00_17580 [Mesorhizobium sp. M7A.T.Ca.TU.009.01.3.1]RUV52028.1 hypothetical protein EOB77_08380 [Mesorhizobium sp. M7A.F.Ca.MR.228.00.0.0]R
MRNVDRISIAGSAPFRAMLAVVFVVLSSLQPGLFASANATGFHSDAGVALQIEESAHDIGGHVGDHKDAVAAAKTGVDKKHPGGEKSANESCEVHCAQVYAVPVDCPELDRIVTRCFPPAVAEVLPGGEYTAHIRPPRPLN